MRSESIVLKVEEFSVFEFMNVNFEKNFLPPAEAVRSAHPGSWIGKAASVTIGSLIAGYDLIIHPWTKIYDPDYRQDRIGQISLKPNNQNYSNIFERFPFGGSWPLENIKFPDGWENHLSALSQKEWLEIKEKSKTLLEFHLNATRKVVNKINPLLKIINLMDLWEKYKEKLFPLLRKNGCIKQMPILGTNTYYFYPDTPGCLFLMLFAGYKHHISGTLMWAYLQKGKGWEYASKLLQLCQEWGNENELPVYIYPPLSVTMKRVSRKKETEEILPPPPETIEVGEVSFKGLPSQYTLVF